MSSTDLTPYGSVAWDEIAGDSHPLELILSRGISVYYKFNRDLYFARIKAADGARFHAKAPIWRPNFVRLASDYDVFLLRLVEENIREIIKTQDCTVAKFVLGGLKASEALSARSSEESWPESLPMWKSDEVEFLECFLVDKRSWEKHLTLLTPQNVFLSFEDFAYLPKVGTGDLYIETEDVALLRREAAMHADVEKPDTLAKRQWPAAIQVLYDVSVAFNSGSISWENREEKTPSARKYAAITEWIETKAPKKVSKKRWKRTVKTIVPIDYNRETNFKELRLPVLSAEMQIPRAHLSVAVYCAMTVAQWWFACPKSERCSDVELGSRLFEVGFRDTAVVDIVSMVVGSTAPHDKNEVKDFITKAIGELRDRGMKELRSTTRSGHVRPESLPIGAATSGVSIDPNCDEEGDVSKIPILAPRL